MATKLQAARKAQGWSQMRLITELQRQAQKIKMPIAGRASLKTLVSRWENGHAVPDECYQRLLRAVFGAGNAELGFAASSSSIIADLASDQAPNDRGLTPTDPQIVEYLFAVLREHSRADNLIGPQFVLGSVLPQVATSASCCEMLPGGCESNSYKLRPAITSSLVGYGKTRDNQIRPWRRQIRHLATRIKPVTHA
jgi:transcriptional regulator with XRE-family HTH domain